MKILKDQPPRVIFDETLGHHRLIDYPTFDESQAYYRDDLFYKTHSPDDWFNKELAEWRAGLWKSYYCYLFKLGKTERAILDWGCGCGWFVTYCDMYTKTRYCAGIDMSQSALTFGKKNMGQILLSPTIEDLEIQEYDAIYLNLVLEHIPYPTHFLQMVIRHLADNGRLIIVVPNDFSRLQMKLNYFGFISPVHVNYFTPESLKFVMEQAGLKVVHESATFPIEAFPLAGINYFGNDILGRRCHRFRLQFEKILGWRVFKFYQFLYNRWRIGRELIFVGERCK
jgi:2-polyprenyl-3-methyl-5-hydroxy-6-metoxy-1,4-benzoquinol methylase